MYGGNSSNSSNSANRSGGGDNNDEGWGSKFLKMAGAAAATAAVAGGLYSLLTSSSSSINSELESPFGAAPHNSKETQKLHDVDDDDDDDHTWRLHYDGTNPSSQIKWKKPEPGWVKLNVDGSCDHIGRPPSAGCGGVLRDSSGTWLHGFAQKLDQSYKVHETEIEAILKGLELASKMNVKKLVLESDHKSAVSMVEDGVAVKHPQFNIISRIRQLLFDPKWQVKVVSIPREANRVANRLANDARDLPFVYLFTYPDPPANCETLLRDDVLASVTYY